VKPSPAGSRKGARRHEDIARPLDRELVEPAAGLISILAAFTLAGCASGFSMMPTPNLYTGPQAKALFTDAPADVRTPPLDVLFVTNRAPAASAEAPEPYTADRSRSLAFGSTTILFGEGVTWDTLVRLSTQRTDPLTLKLGPTKELGRYPPIPYGVVETAGGLMRAPEVIEAHETASRALQAEVQRRLAASARKEIVLFVHGYNNSFSDAALTMGELCHFLGREFVCAIFTWPAGGTRGILFGYDVDYESSVYAVEHLRKTIRTIATTPGLERIHLLAPQPRDGLARHRDVRLGLRGIHTSNPFRPALQNRQYRAAVS
jgi:esterase/lipase superfamily enzyme